MNKPISSAEMKDEANETWKDCLDEGGIMTDYERGYHQGKADAKEPWVGLTEEEVKECFKITPDLFLPWHIYARIEAKLKEKNGGSYT